MLHVIGMLIVMAAVSGMVLAMFLMVRGSAISSVRIRDQFPLLLVMTAFLVCGIALIRTGLEGPRAKTPADLALTKRFQALVPMVTHVEAKAGTLRITYTNPDPFSGYTWVVKFFKDAQRIMTRLGELTDGQTPQQVTFIVGYQVQDSFGFLKKIPGMKILYDPGTFERLKFQQLEPYRMMQLPEKMYFSTPGRLAALDFCVEAENARNASEFCKQSAFRLEGDDDLN